MKKVFTADKNSYGSGFYEVCDTLDELKRAIVEQQCMFIEEGVIKYQTYSEDLFKEALADGEYTMYTVDLHPDEEIVFNEYDGKSWFKIEKIDKGILSRSRRVEE